MPRNTSTGGVLEQMVLPALARGDYSVRAQARVGTRPGGGVHVVDVVAEKSGETILISMKWQQTSGTAEQKVPFEVMCLADAVRGGFGDRAYLVLGGTGWKLRDYYTSGALKDHLLHAGLVNVLSLEGFVALANRGEL